jgi:hypothetical protein
MKEYFYCVARGHHGAWEAICLDLDIAVQGRSRDEVKRLLNSAIHSYLIDAAKEPEPTRSQLMSRSVPLHVRALWALRLGIASVRGRRLDRNNNSAVGFQVACHA